MSLETAPAREAPKGWFAGLFRAPPPRAVRRSVRAGVETPVLSALGPVLSVLASEAELTEARMRAATSGFELGEYDPIVRRN